MTKRKIAIASALVLAAVGGVPVLAQQVSDDLAFSEISRGTKNMASSDSDALKASASVTAVLYPRARWREMVVCNLDRPSEIQRYNVTCTGATRLDAQVADCCMVGDHWEAKIKAWDSAPNTAVTTAPGAVNVFGVSSRVYNYGGTAQAPGQLNAEVDCSYIHGINVFPAGANLALSSDGTCTVTDLGTSDAINRTP